MPEVGNLEWVPSVMKGIDKCAGPTLRTGHSLVVIGLPNNPKAVLIGGCTDAGVVNEVWNLKLGPEVLEWEKPKIGQPDKAPCARWLHTATLLPDGKNIFVFGGMDRKKRYDDGFLLSSDKFRWADPKLSGAVPQPRASHTATLVGDQLFIFGGYGGHGYSRVMFNDLYSMDCNTFEFSKVAATGKIPDPRSNHVTVCVRNMLYVLGGRSFQGVFEDMHILDLDEMKWAEETSVTLPEPTYGHTGVACLAVPTWKAFFFGGSQGTYSATSDTRKQSNQMLVLDADKLTWLSPVIAGEPPAQREMSQMVYDQKNSRLVMIGGWANKLFEDIHTLDVSMIVGPPYAISGCEPQIGPVDGGTELIIDGMGFEDNCSIVVRFSFGKGEDTFKDAAGEYISPTQVKVITPDFEEFGPKKVDVKMAMKGEAMTTTKTSYQFFENTKAENCIVFGPGTIGGATGAPTSIIIQAVDGAGTPRNSGLDTFIVEICDSSTNVTLEPEEISVLDHDDGTYLITFTPPPPAEGKVASAFRIDIMYGKGENPNQLRGSPFEVEFRSDVDPAVNEVGGGPTLQALSDEIAELEKFCNATLKGLEEPVAAGDTAPLLRVMGHCFEVKQRSQEAITKFERHRELIGYLKKYHKTDKSNVLRQLEGANTVFAEISKGMPEVRTRIAQPMKVAAADTKTKVDEFTHQCNKYREEFKKNPFFQYETGPEASYASADEGRKNLVGLTAEKDALVETCKVYEFPEIMEPAANTVTDCSLDIDSILVAWKNAEKITTTFIGFDSCPWTDVDATAMEEEAKGLQKDVKKLDRRIRWADTFKQQEIQVKNMLVSLPLVGDLRHPSMRERHWDELKKVTNTSFTITPEFKLKDLLDLELHKFGDDVGEIVEQAQKEQKMEETLETLKETWSAFEMVYEQHKDTDLKTMRLDEDTFDTLEDNQLVVQGMMASKYLATFEEEVTGWQKTLATVADVVMVLSEIQRTWAYLENLFIDSDEVKRELPEDAKRFAGIHEEIKIVLYDGVKETNVIKCCSKPGLFDQLEAMKGQLELCEKSLADFMDAKKRLFPRFYFTSATDLLDMLSNGSEPLKIMQHMPKVICGIAELVLEGEDEDRPTATGMIAAVGVETVTFHKKLKLENKIESYLQDCIDVMQETLRQSIISSMKGHASKSRLDWLYEDPAQVCVVVSQVNWVMEVEKALDTLLAAGGPGGNSMKEYRTAQNLDIIDLIACARSALTKPQRTRVMCLITMDSHNRDINDVMIREEVYDKENFLWASQLRPKFLTDIEKIQFFICDALVWYGLEYLGNGARLVVTPLTDRIYVTATQAQHLYMGCAPAGPAGTGKTESTKDLSSNLAVPIYVFNCAPEMDYRSLGDIFKGLAASGAWGCFDEFNRLIPEVLSVCTVQYKAVTDAIGMGLKEFMLQGDMMTLIPSAMAFITMNPGYLGRSELPEGLKALFRPITVMVPDLGLICENMLMAEGFETADVLGKKFVTLYLLNKDLLSVQKHYDWGMRAIKSVLVVAGGFKRAEPELDEGSILMRALRDFNIPKIIGDDMVVFMGLLGDLFPGLDPPRKRDMTFEKLLADTALELDINPDEQFVLKTVQLAELMEIRHCVFIMGPPGSGKSSCWKVLCKTKNKGGQQFTHLFPNQSPQDGKEVLPTDVNPKSIETSELYGYVNMSTREWKDGLLSMVMRDLGNLPDKNPKWIMLDGDLDANWIESMNSVMDDNKILTLPSNERITLYPHMRMIFEIRDLKHATPATSSRAGVLFLSDVEGFQWKSAIKSWVKKQTEEDGYDAEVKETLTTLFETYCGPTLFEMKLQSMAHVIPMIECQLVLTMLHLLEGLFTKEVLKNQRDMLEILVVFSAVWGFGSPLCNKDNVDWAKEFSGWWKSNFKNVKFPSRGTVFDYYVDMTEKKFEPWAKICPTIEYSSGTPMSQVTVPTPETTSFDFLLDLLIPRRYPALLVGSAGTGKTQMLIGKLQKVQDTSDGDFIFSATALNYFSDSMALQGILEQSLEKKAGINYGPPGKARCIFVVDDLNMPQLDAYETQSAIALMRQHFDYDHWYDRTKFTKKNIMNVQFMSCMNPTAGCGVVNPRLQRWYMVFSVELPGGESLYTIYNTFLEGHLKVGFVEEVQKLSSNLIRAALTLHTQVGQTFRKTAVNFHYEFNIRHIARVFVGLLGSRPEQFSEPDKMVRLWLHESERTYGDLLVTYDNLAAYNKLAQGVAKKLFADVNIDRFYAKDNPDPLVFCHFAGGDLSDKLYDEVTSFDRLNEILTGGLKDYNETFAVMNLVLFVDAMKHICRITRTINSPSGHALLVGVGGSGKQSLSRLSAFICDYSVTQIQISQAYTVNSSPGLKEDIRTMYTKAGLKEEGICFLFTDSQISDERFLVYLNDLLSSGDIPGLFAPDEEDNVINGVRSRVKAAGINETKDNCWNFFIQTVKANLHMCMCMSPVGEAMARRAQRFPALITCTSVDWFQAWPASALLSVAQKFLGEIEGGLGDEEVTESVIKFMPYSFQVATQARNDFAATEKRLVYMTPKSYLELLEFYKTMLETKRHDTDAAIERLDTGLTKLLETASSVAVMEEELKIKSVEVAEKLETAQGIAEVVGKEKAIVDEESSKAAEEGAACDIIAAEAGAIAEDAEADLAKAEPAVAAAVAALDTLNKTDLGEAKGMAKPPGGVDDIFASCLVLLANAGGAKDIATDKKGKPKDVSWKAAQLCMKDVVGFIARLKGFKPLIDTDQVPKVNFDHVRPYLALEYFNYDAILKKSKAAAGCCLFVVNIVMYYDIVVTVEPKRIALKAAQDKLNGAQTKLAAVNALVAELQAKLKILVDQLDEANAVKDAALAESASCERKLGLAQRLVNALSSEKVRWAANIEELKANYGLLVGDCILAAAFVSYVGPFTKSFRSDLLDNKWAPYISDNKIPMSDPGEIDGVAQPSDPLKILVDNAEIAGWGSEGLPSDRVSVENGTIVTRSARWPLMIDPQLQGIAWIKERESARNLQVTRLTNKNMITVMERSIENGNSVLIENMGENVEAVLANIVGRRYFKKGRNFYVQLGDKEVQYNDNFKLFLHTKLSNPHYPPEIQAEATIINFMVTEDGLEDQLLALVVRKERPDLEEQKAQLISDQNGFMIKTKELEDDLLFRLANAEGDITEDVELIENLEEAKRIAMDIAEKQVVAVDTEIKINIARESYRPVASRGALLFFLMNNLNKVHTFYQFSLNAYVTVFLRGIDLVSKPKGPKNPLLKLKMAVARVMKKFSWNVDILQQARATGGGGAFGGNTAPPKPASPEELEARLEVLAESVQFTIFSYIRRGLFERDKLMFATQLTLWVRRKMGDLLPDEVGFLISCPQKDTGVQMSVNLAEWLPESSWLALQALKEIKGFEKLPDDMDNSPDVWKRWYDFAKPEEMDLPKDYKSVTQFQKILILRVIRPDRVTPSIIEYITEHMGGRYIDQDAFDMRSVFNESSPSCPVFFVLFPGVDPTPDVEKLGKSLGFTVDKNNYIDISMGQGQEALAEMSLDNFAKNGGWVFLQNIHLMATWLPTLERKLEICAENGHDDFRCFLSAEQPMFAGNPSPMVKSIPESILQSCIEVSNEAPTDAKSNLRMAYANFSEDKWEKVKENAKKVEDTKNCLLTLCVFHTMLLGRAKFGAQGWSRKYPFNTGDLTISSNVLSNYIAANAECPYEDLKYIFGEIMYGGHITDPWDRRVDNTYLEVLLGPHTQTGYAVIPGFPLPDANETDFDGYRAYIEEKMPMEDPTMYGLHGNAGIGNLIAACNGVFDTIMDLAGSGGGGAGGRKKEDVVKEIVEEYSERLPEQYNMFEINSRIEEKTPYVMIVLQECTVLNRLIGEMRRSLIELSLGLQGSLNMSAPMEELSQALYTGTVPGSAPGSLATWAGLAYPSKKKLLPWYGDLLLRITQMQEWSDTLTLPKSVWISGLFNGQAFLTAIKQTTARRDGLALDIMDLLTDVTASTNPAVVEEVDDGALIHGLFMEGARWHGEDQVIAESFLKELHPVMPVIHAYSKPSPAYNDRTYGKTAEYYVCPCFVTTARGGTYVFNATMKMSEGQKSSRWVLAGVCLLYTEEG